MDTRLKAEIEVIDQTLVRLSPGEYGRCEYCLGDISDARLSATTLCVVCAQAKEAAGE